MSDHIQRRNHFNADSVVNLIADNHDLEDVFINGAHSQTPYEVAEGEADELRTNVQPVPHLSTAALNAADFSAPSMSFLNTPTDLELMKMGLNVHEPTWLLGDNFDIDALNQSLSNTFPQYGAPTNDFVEQQTSQNPVFPNVMDNYCAKNHDLVPEVQRRWYATLPRNVVCYDIPDQLQGRSWVDNGYREGLLLKLQPRPSNAALPSADFLWDRYICREKREVLSLVQAATIGQTFGMLSGDPSDVCMTECFHGTVIAWARQGGLFKSKHVMINSLEDPGLGVDDMWKEWIHKEESIRLLLGLYIQDSEFSVTFHHEPLLRHAPGRIPHCCSDEAFFAPNAAEWYRLVRRDQSISNNGGEADSSMSQPSVSAPGFQQAHMLAYASLANIVGSIQETKASCLDKVAIDQFREALLSWHQVYVGHFPRNQPNYINLMIWWHASFMALYADADLLERSIGRDGREVAEQAKKEIDEWATSSEARKGVLHALLVLKHLEMLPIGSDPAIHVPKAVFYAAMAVYSYIKFMPKTGSCYTPSQDEIAIPELQVSEPVGPSQTGKKQTDASSFPPVESSTLCSAMDLLWRIGHWEISRKLSSILEVLMDDLVVN
ncbi:hypothetical protein CGCF245_v003805 [Colletotrichum fructicola]|nr:hypothetical protein CGCF245_v003805 [Colletotrichum fructicola]